MEDIAGLWRQFAAPGLDYLLGFALFSLLLVARRWRQEQAVLRPTLRLLLAALSVHALGLVIAWGGSALFGDVVHLIGWIGAGLAVIRLFGLAVFRSVLPRVGVNAPRIIEDIAVTIGYIAWGLFQLRLAGVDPTSLVTTSAVITAIIAFSMQDTLGNALGGLFLELDDSLSIGDWVKIDDVSGRVEQIRWRHTAIRTRNGELVIVPNSTLMRTRFTVIGNPEGEPVRWRRWLWFDTKRTCSPGQVIGVAEAMFTNADIGNLAPGSEPSCVLMEMTHGYLRFGLRYWLRDPALDDPTDSAVRVHLYAALQRAGIELASPEQFIRTIHENRQHTQEKETRDFARRRAALKGVELFASLSEEEVDTLARRLVHAPFAAGDIITRQGAIAHWLYLLDTGRAGVFIERVPGNRHQVTTLTSGSYFGEMGLLTGEPRRATVVALSDVECYRLDKASFGEILQARPALAQQLSNDLVAREKELGDALHAANNDVAQGSLHNSATMLTRILNFFGLSGSSRIDY